MIATDLDALHAALDANPFDQGARAVLADLLQERGDGAAADCLRWMAAKGRVPLDWSNPAWSWATFESTPMSQSGESPDRSGLPAALYGELEKPHEVTGPIGSWSAFRSRRAAEEALMFAWGELSEADRAACHRWKPN